MTVILKSYYRLRTIKRQAKDRRRTVQMDSPRGQNKRTVKNKEDRTKGQSRYSKKRSVKDKGQRQGQR